MTLNKKIFIPLVLTLALSSCGGGSPSPSPTPETTFTVTFNSNGGSNVPSQNIKSGEKATRPSDPKKDGYTFDNWFKDNSFSNVYDFSTPVITNLTLYAKWNINSYTVTFNTNGGSEISSQTVNYGEKVTRPTNPIKEGYTFENWYKDSSLTNIYDFKTSVTSNITLYANWRINQYTITFDTNGGSEIPSQTVNYGEKVSKPSDPTKKGHSFIKWYKESSFINVYDFSSPVFANITLFAKWYIHSYTVTFNTNGGSEIPSQTVNYGEKVNEPDQPTKEGYYFYNWFADSTLETIFDFNTTYVTSDITIYVKWRLFEYDIVYNLNGGINPSDNPIKYTFEDEITFVNPTKEGHTFVNWTKGGVPITGIKKGSIGNITIDANWNTNQYQVNVYTNDEEKGTVEGGGIFNYGTEVSVVARTFGDYIFDGWYSNSHYTNLLSKNCEYIFNVPSHEISLYARFLTKEEEKEAEWNQNHGVISVISEGGKTLTYGLYPQIHVNDTALIAELEKIAPEADEEYFFYNDEYYVKDTGNPYDLNYTFLDGTNVVKGNIYYFKCVPIIWNIISLGQNYIIDCSNILYGHRFNNYGNYYPNCELRTWLNSDFYNRAFSIKTTSSSIVPTDLRDVDVTGDKVWIGSRDQYNGDWYSSDSAREKKVSDFAICNCAFMVEEQFYRNCGYWTRFPDPKDSGYAWALNYDGSFCCVPIGAGMYGCSPSLTITF